MEAETIPEHTNAHPRVAANQPQAFIRIARVKELSGLSKSTARRWIKAGRFPGPVVVEGNTVLWDLAEVMQWRADQFRKRAERESEKG